MNYWKYLASILIAIIIQIGLIIRRKIIEDNKTKRIEKLKELSNSKIKAIGDYEKN